MSKLENLMGMKFNKLTVLERDLSHKDRPYWKCQCECGNIVSVRADLLKSGNTKACGCMYRKHNQALQGNHSRLYEIYNGMKKRCYNPNCKSFKFYGEIGITICDEWIGNNGFISFMKWALSCGYAENLSIDRIKSDLSYSPENCRWVKWGVQANNKKNNVFICYNGKTQTLANWCRELKLNYPKVAQRLRHNKTFEEAIVGAEI